MELQTRYLRKRRGADFFLEVGEQLDCPKGLAAGGVAGQEDELGWVNF